MRVGDNPGEHTIVFAPVGRDDRNDRPGHEPRLLRLRALAAAKFLAARPAGMYGMKDVLGFAFYRVALPTRSQAPPGNALMERIRLEAEEQWEFCLIVCSKASSQGGRASGTVCSQAEPGNK